MNDASTLTADVPIVVIAFDRPSYLENTLVSLKLAGAQDNRVSVFIDGATSTRNMSQVLTCQDVARKIFPGCAVYLSAINLGIMKNFRRAERHIFVDMKADVAYFFEDDMLVSNEYLKVMDGLAEIARDNPRIGAFAAYGLMHEEPKDTKPAELVGMIWNWGFGLRKESWLRREEILKDYYILIENVEYHERPFGLIGHWCRVVGCGVLLDHLERRGSTSQDVIKKSALSLLGAASVMPAIVNARYIGEKGENFTPEAYAELGFANQLFDQAGTYVPIESDRTHETQMGVAAQDGHMSNRAVPGWLRSETSVIPIEGLWSIYGVDEMDQVQLRSPEAFLEDLEELCRNHDSIHRTVAEKRRVVSRLQVAFIRDSEVSTISVCFDRALKTGFHFTTSPFIFIDNDPYSIGRKFSFIEFGDIAMLDREVDFRVWFPKARMWLQPGGTILGFVRKDSIVKYRETLTTVGFQQDSALVGYLRYSLQT